MPRPIPERALLESWLRRASPHAEREQLYLRGSVLMDALCPGYRDPMDVDYLAGGAFDAARARALVLELAAAPDPAGDALTLDAGGITTEIIWGDTNFPGVRARLPIAGGPSFTVDLGFGDPLSTPPRPVEVARVGAVPAIAAETLFAFKVHGLVEHGRGKWRAKDLADLYMLWTRVPLDRALLHPALALAFESRNTSIAELEDLLTRDTWGTSTGGRKKWRAFTRAVRVALPDFVELRDVVRAAIRSAL